MTVLSRKAARPRCYEALLFHTLTGPSKQYAHNVMLKPTCGRSNLSYLAKCDSDLIVQASQALSKATHSAQSPSGPN